MDINFESYVVSWSPKQEVFHIEKVADMLKANRKILVNGTKSDFIPIGFYGTHDEASDDVTRIKNNQKSGQIDFA
ncbi:MAG: hypothetical protein OCD00_14035 [Colwellia sp.]